MKLGVLDRVAILNLLPSEGDVTTLRIIRDMRMALSFSEEELAFIEFEHEGTQLKGFKHDVEKDVEIGPRGHAVIMERFAKLDEQKKMPIDFLPVYEKFVGDV